MRQQRISAAVYGLFFIGTGVAVAELSERPDVAAAAEAAPAPAAAIDVNNPESIPEAGGEAPVVPVDPKPLSGHVRQGLDWIVTHQNEDGGWGQGEESQHMGHGMDGVRDVSNVADTGMAVMALLRAGSTPAEGTHAPAIQRGIGFICTKVEQADDDSMSVTDINGTRLQGKIGTHIDTFVAALVLSEAKDRMPDPKANARVGEALVKIITKIEKNQQADGRWGGQGWAAGLGEGLGVKAINRAAQRGVAVDDEVLALAQVTAQGSAVFGDDGKFEAAGKDAGIELYAAADAVGRLNDFQTRNAGERDGVEAELAEAQRRDSELKAKLAEAEQVDAPALVVSSIRQEITDNGSLIEERFRRIEQMDLTEEQLVAARGAAIQRFEDPKFVAGFGNNGGEEFLSYLQLGEALHAAGGDEFADWDAKMTANLNRIQNDDGSWSGHHCITGRTFCTSAALLVLTIDRATTGVAAMGRDR